MCSNIRSYEVGSSVMEWECDEDGGDVVRDFVRTLARLDLADNGMYSVWINDEGDVYELRFSVHSV